MTGFCPSGEKTSGFPKQQMPDFNLTLFLWAHVVVNADWVYMHGLGL